MVYISTNKLPNLITGSIVIALSLIFALGLILRVDYLYLLGGSDYLTWANINYFGGITPFYITAGKAIFESGTYRNLNYPPGYPIFVGFWHYLGLDINETRMVQAVIDALTIFPFYRLLRRIKFSVVLALLGALVYAIYPAWSIGAVTMLAEALTPASIVWIMATLVWASGSSKHTTWFWPGITIGISALVRPDVIILIIPAGLWILWQKLPWLKIILAALWLSIGFGIPIFGWGFYNLQTHGVFVITSTSGGNGLWEGLGELPNEYGYVLDDAYAGEWVTSLGIEWHSVEADRFFKQQYLRAWQEHPDFVLKVIWRRWEQIATEQERLFDRFFYLPNATRFAMGFNFIEQYGLLFLLAAGIIAYRQPARLLILFLPLGTALFSIGLVHYEARYVRYVPLGYIVAIGICLEFIYYKTMRFFQNGSQTRIITVPYLEFALILFIIFFAAYELYWQLYQWQAVKTGSEEVVRLAGTIPTDAIAQKYGGEELTWRQLTPDTILHKKQEGWVIRTEKSINTNQVATTIPISGPAVIYIPFSLELLEGGAFVNLLGNSGKPSLFQAYFTEPGFHQSYIGGIITDQDKITIAFGNYEPDSGQSEFIISNLEVYYKKVSNIKSVQSILLSSNR
jgi:hypothetical protein